MLTTTKNEFQQIEDDPLAMFMYGLKAKESRRQYPRRLKVFMDFCGLEGSLEDQAKGLFLKAKNNNIWIQGMLIKFIEFQKQRVKQGEILEATIRNYSRSKNEVTCLIWGNKNVIFYE